MPFTAPKPACDAKGAAPIAAGIVFVAPDGDVLLLRRSADEKNFGGHWGLPGGKGEAGEGPLDCALREAREELGVHVEDEGLRVIDRILTPNGMVFTTFVKAAADKFAPKLELDPNHEHSGYCWASLDMLPQPLHPSVARTLGEHIGVAADMKPEDWKELRATFAKWTREEEAEPEHAKDEALLAMDKAYDARGKRIIASDILAMDLSPSVRTYDKDGQLHIARTPISKAMICEYYGREIPNHVALGLDPQRKYRLLRDPEELKKGAASSNGKQLMFEHVPVNADDTQKDVWVGAVGTDAEFDAPYLYNSLHVHDRMGIEGIESEEQKEISSSYRYRADMTPGAYQGQSFDGVMRDIDFNHVCLVKAGRCGDDVFVHDAKPEECQVMSKTVLSRKAAVLKGAVSAYLMPKLAMDAKGVAHKVDVTPILATVTAGNFKARQAQIISGITAAVKDKLAMDAKLDDLPAFLGAFDADEPEKADDEDDKDKDADKAKDKAKDADPDDKKAAMDNFLKEKLSAEDKAAFDALCGADDEDEDDKDAAKDKAKDAAPALKPDTVTKPAMDAAIDAATKRATAAAMAQAKAIREAERAVQPYVGELSMAFDSAADVYKHALEANDVDVTGVDPSAFPAMLKLVTPPGSKPKGRELAMDAAPSDSFTKLYGDDAMRLTNA